MAGLNKILLIGNVGRDPEMRYTPSGSAVTNFSLAVSRRYQGQDGEQREETEWFRVDCWNRLAEIANQYVTKGKQVYVEGRLRSRTYQDRNGETRVSLDVTATELQLLGQRGEGDAGDQIADRSAAPANADFDNMPF